MKLNETTLPFLEVDCIQQFGQEKGKLIFEQAEKIYQELLNNADYRNNAAIQNHLQLKLFPTLAYYKALRGEGINQNETSVYKGYKQDKIEMRGDRAEMSDFPPYLNTVAGGLDRRDQTIGGFSFVVKIYAVPVVEIIG